MSARLAQRDLSALRGFDELQGRLGEALAANQGGSGVDHVLIALPLFSAGESLLSPYVDRIAGLEHRYLLAVLMLHRIESCELAFITCRAPDPEIVTCRSCRPTGGTVRLGVYG